MHCSACCRNCCDLAPGDGSLGVRVVGRVVVVARHVGLGELIDRRLALGITD